MSAGAESIRNWALTRSTPIAGYQWSTNVVSYCYFVNSYLSSNCSKLSAFSLCNLSSTRCLNKTSHGPSFCDTTEYFNLLSRSRLIDSILNYN